MKILAMDTSTMVMGVAIMEDAKVLGEVITNLKKNHSVRLMPAIDQLLSELELTVTDIDLLAVTKGPGSYTGIRIAVTAAKTLAWANEIPLYSLSSLTLLARNAYRFHGFIVPMIDARRERVYTGIFQMMHGVLQEVIPQQVLPIKDLLEIVASYKQPVLVLGEDVERYRKHIEAAIPHNILFGMGVENIPRPSQLGLAAWEKRLSQEEPESSSFAPDYLQMTEAETKWIQQRKEIREK